MDRQKIELMHSGSLYLPTDSDLAAAQTVCLERLYDYNATRPGEAERRTELLREMFAEIGEGCYIEPPLHANWGGRFVRFGRGVYANFNLTLVDDAPITVGDYTMFGPNVTVAAAAHPIPPELRRDQYQYNLSVTIGSCCWIGAGALIMPGVTIGDGSIIGAGSIVTHDIPPNTVAYGNPCRPVRQIDDDDRSRAAARLPHGTSL